MSFLTESYQEFSGDHYEMAHIWARIQTFGQIFKIHTPSSLVDKRDRTVYYTTIRLYVSITLTWKKLRYLRIQ